MKTKNPKIVPILLILITITITLSFESIDTYIRITIINAPNLIFIMVFLLPVGFLMMLPCHYFITFIHELLHYRAIRKTQVRLGLPKHKIYIHLYIGIDLVGYTYSDTLLELKQMGNNPEALRAIQEISNAPHTSAIKKLTIIPILIFIVSLALSLQQWKYTPIPIITALLLCFYIFNLVLPRGTDQAYYKSPQDYKIDYRISGWFKKSEPIHR